VLQTPRVNTFASWQVEAGVPLFPIAHRISLVMVG